MSRAPFDRTGRGFYWDCGRYRIAESDFASRDHLGIDAAIGVIEIVQKRARNCQVADSGLRIDVGGGATLYSLDDLQPRGLCQ